MFNAFRTVSYEITPVYLFVCLSVCLSVCLYVHPFARPPVTKFSQDWMIADHDI